MYIMELKPRFFFETELKPRLRSDSNPPLFCFLV